MRPLMLTVPFVVIALAVPVGSPAYTLGGEAPRFVTPVVGMGGCAGRGCHGDLVAPGEPVTSPSAFTGWVRDDPHRDAYRVLSNELSKRIMRKLYPNRPDAPAAEDARCLACHATPALAALPDERRGTENVRKLLAEGITCEACHGGASRWLRPHTTWSNANAPKEERKPLYAEHGMTWMNDPSSRVNVCVGCHVGTLSDPPREVNHDLIAAGHPRLTFEFHAYMKAMPPHWAEADRAATGPPVARPKPNALAEWQVGQVECARAALDLLGDRATKGPTWPELSEYDCWSCHHDLRPKLSYRQEQGPEPGLKPGQLPWSRWAWPLPSRVWSGTEPAYRTLAQAMAKPNGPRRGVVGAAKELRDAVGGKALAVSPLPDDQLNRMSWDDAAQYFLALVALRDADKDAIDDGRLQAARKVLELRSQGANSPKSFRVETVVPAELFRGVVR